MNLAAIMLHLRKLEADSVSLQARLYELESDASRMRATATELHPAHAELLEATRNLLSIAQRGIKRTREAL